MLRPIKNNIIFAFIDDINGKSIVSKMQNGIIRVANVTEQNVPRWGKVLAIGEAVVPEISVGKYVLIEPLMWTTGAEIDDIRVWKTDDSKVMAIADEPLYE
jgi:hypothetical protein